LEGEEKGRRGKRKKKETPSPGTDQITVEEKKKVLVISAAVRKGRKRGRRGKERQL